MTADRAYLEHMREAIRRVLDYSKVGRADFEASTLHQDAVIRNLEILGEATKRVSAETRAAHPDIPWKSMARLRDVLIHNYLGVDIRIVWDVVENRLAGVQEHISHILNSQE